MTVRHTLLSAALIVCAASAGAVETSITVRAVSRDAKIIGSNVGGARITVRDVASGRVLASGVQQGGTGDTARIMVEPRERGRSIYDTKGAAAFVASFDIAEPTNVEIVAEGPLNYPQSMQRVAKTLTVLPGQSIGGDGVILEIHGYNVDLLEPAEESIAAGDVSVRVRMTMTCGCPLEPGGMWNADPIMRSARLSGADGFSRTTTLDYAGTPSTFTGVFRDVPAGTYELEITAADATTANFTRYRKTLVVR